ncbi:NADH dehydrogenase [ubiquinone] 1 alpha subcomplex subunit 2 [Linum perenne]
MCQSSPSSSSIRVFVEKNYKDLKKLNSKLPILIRECSGIEPQLWARYGKMTQWRGRMESTEWTKFSISD